MPCNQYAIREAGRLVAARASDIPATETGRRLVVVLAGSVAVAIAAGHTTYECAASLLQHPDWSDTIEAAAVASQLDSTLPSAFMIYKTALLAGAMLEQQWTTVLALAATLNLPDEASSLRIAA